MCGRFSLTASADIIADVFGIEGLIDIVPRYNIAPSTPLLCIGMRDGKRVSRLLKWGLIPFWAEDPKIAYKLINARSETAASKPSFRAAFTARRVLIVADGFYEWQREGKTRLPFHIRRPNREVFAMAGLW